MAKYVICKEWSAQNKSIVFCAYRTFLFGLLRDYVTGSIGFTLESCEKNLLQIHSHKMKPEIVKEFEIE